jgi:hypothetical protein
MLTSSVVEDTNILTATYDGSVDAEEMIAVRDRLRTVIRRHGGPACLSSTARSTSAGSSRGPSGKT